MKCCLCNEEIKVEEDTGWDQGHNAAPLASGRCCDSCNVNVITARMKDIIGSREEETEDGETTPSPVVVNEFIVGEVDDRDLSDDDLDDGESEAMKKDE